MASGTRWPAFIVLSALIPKGVWFLTLSRRRSPEDIAESWGNRWRSRSACVPFPTPGAPTRIMRAALRSLEVIFAMSIRMLKCKYNNGVLLGPLTLVSMMRLHLAGKLLNHSKAWLML